MVVFYSFGIQHECTPSGPKETPLEMKTPGGPEIFRRPEDERLPISCWKSEPL
jgi:hypothetical protein